MQGQAGGPTLLGGRKIDHKINNISRKELAVANG